MYKCITNIDMFKKVILYDYTLYISASMFFFKKCQFVLMFQL